MRHPGRALLILGGALGVGYGAYVSIGHFLNRASGPSRALPPSEFLPALIVPKAPDETCRETYVTQFPRPKIDIRVVLGYKDARPARFVGDRYERTLLVDYLLSECPTGFFACGFRRADDDADELTKTTKGRDGRPREIVLRISHSSVGPDDDANRDDSFQATQSAAAQSSFLSGLRDADVVLYNGHSRDGGGPDFFPPRLRADGYVDYYGYHQRRDAIEDMRKALRARKAALPLLGLFSCASSRHFVDTVRQAKAGTGVIASPRLLYYADALKDLLGALSAIVGEMCASDLDGAMEKSERSGFFLDKWQDAGDEEEPKASEASKEPPHGGRGQP